MNQPTTKIPSQGQLDGSEFLMDRVSAVLGDDVGEGKTAQVLIAIKQLGLKRVIWVTGGTQIPQVTDDDGPDFAPGVSTRAVHGPKSLRARMWGLPAKISVVSYETFRSDSDSIANCPRWDLLVLDDASHFKNPESGLTKAANKVAQNCDRGWAITATAIETSLADFWSICNAINFYPWGTLDEFYQKYCNFGWEQQGRGFRKVIKSYKNLDDFKSKLSTFYLRRIGTRSTPPINKSLVYVELTPEQIICYLNARKGKYGVDLFSRWTKCMQACDTDAFFPTTKHKSSKIAALIEIIGATDSKIVVYSNWKLVLREIAQELVMKSIKYVTITGDISMSQRRENQLAFNDNPDVRMCLLSRAGEQGLNLQGGRIMVCINRIANPQRMHQIHGRISRRSSEFDRVFVIDLVASRTVEERLIALSDTRQSLADYVNNEDSAPRLSTTDMGILLAEDEKSGLEEPNDLILTTLSQLERIDLSRPD